MYLKQAGFWEREKTAPLMLLDKGYLEKQTFDAMIERAKTWVDMVLTPEERDAPENKEIAWPENLEISRIVVKDSERTFMEEEDRKMVAKFLALLEHNFKDYAQGLSFLASTLLLFLPEAQVLAMLTKINNDPKYIPGYWRTFAVAFARDSYVFDHLLRLTNPVLAAHLAKCGALPETFCQKYMVALCIHVLPFEALFEFLENFFKLGVRYLFQFTIAFVKALEPQILQANDTATVFALLRLDTKMITYDEALPLKAVRDALEVDISTVAADEALDKLREDTFNSKLKSRFDAQAAAQAAAQEKAEAEKRRREEKLLKGAGEDDDEDDDSMSDFDSDEDDEGGVECQICENNWPDFYCKDCDKLVCGMCHDKKRAPHAAGHKVKAADDETIERITSQLAKTKL